MTLNALTSVSDVARHLEGFHEAYQPHQLVQLIGSAKKMLGLIFTEISKLKYSTNTVNDQKTPIKRLCP